MRIRPSSNLVSMAHGAAAGNTNLLQSEVDSTSPFAAFGTVVSPFGSISSSISNPFGDDGSLFYPPNDASENESGTNTASESGSSSQPAESDSFGHSTTAVSTQSDDPTSSVPPATFRSESTTLLASTITLSIASDSPSSSGKSIGLRCPLVWLIQPRSNIVIGDVLAPGAALRIRFSLVW